MPKLYEDRLVKNICDQIKEAQIKLGYAKETVRLYYPLDSLNALLKLNITDINEMQEVLKEHFSVAHDKLGEVKVSEHGGRIEIMISPKASEYVHENVKEPEFLKDIIELFGHNHHCSIDDIKAVFEKYSKDYVVDKMPEGSDFDYEMHFNNESIDEYYYCIKMEMGHTIYHRFMKEDYLKLL